MSDKANQLIDRLQEAGIGVLIENGAIVLDCREWEVAIARRICEEFGVVRDV